MPALMRFEAERPISALFAARHVNERQELAPLSSGQYPRYHQEIRDILKTYFDPLVVTDTPEGIAARIAKVDYVFALMNRLPMRNGELFISTLCERLQRPYLGARPSVRATAEDKALAKHVARSRGVPTPAWTDAGPGRPLPARGPFAGPYFVKPRMGAASEYVSPRSFREDWAGVQDQVCRLREQGLEVLIEAYQPGLNITVPILGGAEPISLPPVILLSEAPMGMLTYESKLQRDGELPFRILDTPRLRRVLTREALALFAEIAPADYARFDFRADPRSGAYGFLEMNICCDISSFGSLMFSAGLAGHGQHEIVSHILAYSHARQKVGRKERQSVE